ncbi:MAG TPA: hypothetical protein VM431_09085 [Phycisphaerae bacterium]|nr:hypothetical protein [Phycisphaerae bacterium]
MPWVEHAAVNWGHWDLTSWLARPLPEQVLARFRDSQEAYDIRLLEDLLAHVGESPDILTHLGYLYTQVRRHRDALLIDQRLVALRPRDPVAFYNLACSHALLGQVKRGFDTLRRAIALGYREFDHMQGDEDLANLRRDPQWAELLGTIKT